MQRGGEPLLHDSTHPRRRGPVTLIVVALVLAALVAGTGLAALTTRNVSVADTQTRTAARITRAWAAPTTTASPTRAVPDGAIGLLTVPRFGADYVRVISEGTTDRVLDSGDIGHYVDTAMPGQVGNTALAGHREANGASLLHITALQRGDRIVVRTRTRTYVYRVTGSRRVDPSAIGAIAPVPWRPEATPTKRMITLQSCTPPLIDTWRYVVWGELTSSTAAPR